MKIKILILLTLLCKLLFSQEKTDAQISLELIKLKRNVISQRDEIRNLEKKNAELEQKLLELSNNLDQKLIRNLELQAQNERAINITLEEFSKKFEAQNKTVEGVKSSLDQQLYYQIIFYSCGIIIFIVFLMIGIKIAIKRALSKQEQNWNNFNEHILKQ